MESITKNLKIIRNRMKHTCEKANRKAEEVRLLLATKTVSSEHIKFALQQGEILVGENKVQELKQKYNAISELKPEIHFIGHLQSNKIKDVIKWASCIESIDNISIAKKLEKRLIFEKKEIDIYIQVNTSLEKSKFGIAPDETINLVKEISKLKNIHIKGLMTIGLLSSKSTEIRKCFQILKQLQQDINNLNILNAKINELSMGMSGDLEIAIEEGATIVRVGTAIFGERIYPDSYYWNEITP